MHYALGSPNQLMKKIAFLAFASIAVLSPRAFANPNPDDVRIDIYRNFNINNPPDGSPYTGFAGQFDLATGNDGFDIDFGTPFGLTTFAAVITFTEWVSTDGLYKPQTDSSNGLTANIFDWGGFRLSIRTPGSRSLRRRGLVRRIGTHPKATTFFR